MDKKLFESIFMISELRNEITICGTIYELPSYDNKSNVIVIAISKDTLKSMKTNHICFTVGDLNCDLFQHDNNKVNDLLGTMPNECFYLLINKPTSVTDTIAIILDNAWTNLYFDDIKTGVVLHPISDHLSAIIQIK